ncbi:MAG TPA: DinB family protein [Ferruginibacter sp.]|nr:DinB family protein [Ferruginibacter sp.]
MKYDHHKSYQVLERTPGVLKKLLSGLDKDWIMHNEGPETFSPYDVVGHLIHGEKTDWKPRVLRILKDGNTIAFDLFDRFAMYEQSKGKTMDELLDEFSALRNDNMNWFASLHLPEEDLDMKGLHPKLGEVTLRNLLSTWVIHDLSHIAQITRVMCKQYKDEMGPWNEYFRIVNF